MGIRQAGWSLVAGGLLAVAGSAAAAPALQIHVEGALAKAPTSTPCTLNAPGYNECEVIGDAGGSSSPWGIPSVAGGWAVAPGFAQDGSFNNALGTSGWHMSYLWLTEAANVNFFYYVGSGDALNHNQFQIFDGSAWQTVFDTYTSALGASATYALAAGWVPFRYLASIGQSYERYVTNDGSGGNPDPNDDAPGYFLGCDPYQVSGPWTNTCATAYIGLTDRPERSAPDHDYQDLGVRISVPEPGSLALVGVGLLGLAGLRRRAR